MVSSLFLSLLFFLMFYVTPKTLYHTGVGVYLQKEYGFEKGRVVITPRRRRRRHVELWGTTTVVSSLDASLVPPDSKSDETVPVEKQRGIVR